jgi:hypothetical protein
VRVAEVHAHAGGGGEFLMPREFLALVVGKALALGFGIELSLPEKPARAEAVASSILASNTGRLVRSTNTPTEI